MIARAADGGCILAVRVHAGAKRNAITGTHNGRLNVSLTSPPADGLANAALVALLAQRLNIPRLSIKLISGATNPCKSLRLAGITAAETEARLLSDVA